MPLLGELEQLKVERENLIWMEIDWMHETILWKFWGAGDHVIRVSQALIWKADPSLNSHIDLE